MWTFGLTMDFQNPRIASLLSQPCQIGEEYEYTLYVQTPLLISEFSYFKVHPLLTQELLTQFNCTHTDCIISIEETVLIERDALGSRT